MSQGKGSKVKEQEPEFFDQLSAEVEQVEDWREPIMDIIKHGRLLQDRAEHNGLRQMSTKYILLDGDVRFCGSFDGILLRCNDTQEAGKVFEEVHLGIYRLHPFGPKLYERIHRLGYY
ncbi:uncharacterized protein LOC105421103 [Amborella trichopoda]|uniref:uncharacterized protein LOC105421103 n=1 Tax=Amborella trichopoda TaxID=13333 RepID=UPI0005D40F9A|nr:uncharacterized protein LOC105421103 [Amborella trichopoda]|eukprot:XP_011625575.1 uncharacterized protein LOC105421103 [Amborella trichopoda]